LFENLSKDNRPETKAITTEEHEYRKNKDYMKKIPEIASSQKKMKG
tara:strand:+ start:589 stop:726 length:138 start_codon:yes stop_codon:yes gene_type:complete